jgi:PKD repeat protein
LEEEVILLKKILIGFVLVMGIVSCVIPVSASVFTINPGTGNVIQLAINSASSGDTIVLNPGTYSENGITITGKNLIIRAADGHGPSDTIIDGKSAAPRIFTVMDRSSLAVGNLTLRNGRAGDGARGSDAIVCHGTNGNPGESGGAVFSEGSLTITGSIITGCSSGTGGRGGSAGLVWGCHGGSGGNGGNGGAIYSTGPVTLASTAISSSSTGNGGGGQGGSNFGADGNSGAGGSGGAVSSTSTVTLLSSTITGCQTGMGGGKGDGSDGGTGGGPGGNGGAISSTGAVTLISSTISDNSAGTGGPGMFDYNYGSGPGGNGGAIFSMSPVTLTSSTITNCSAGAGGKGDTPGGGDGGDAGDGGDGGAIYAQSSVTITGTTIDRCSAGNGGVGGPGDWLSDGGPGGAGGNGGAVYAPGNTVMITTSTISRCSAGNGGSSGDDINGGNGGHGGAIEASAVTLTSSIIESSRAGNGGNGGENIGNGGNGGSGGAIFADTTTTITSSTISNCTAGSGSPGGSDASSGSGGSGGAVYSFYGPVSVTGSTFNNCVAYNKGGAIFTDYAVTATSSTFSNCRAFDGGAVYGRGGPIHFCRFVNNDKNIFGWLDGTSVYSPGRSFDATNNWWGSNNDPSEQVNSVVSYSPWLVLGITSTPPPITSQDYAITANLTYDSDGISHDPALGHVPDGIPVSYAVLSAPDTGFVSPTSAGIADGISQTTFTSTKPGTAMVSATVDNQTTSTFIERPIADFTMGGRSVVRQRQAAEFTDQSISTLPLTYAWDFGDGTTSNEQNPPPHIYNKEENYTVILTVSNALGHDTKVDYILATPPNPLKANFMAENKAGQSPLMVTFTDHSNVSVKVPSYPAINSWMWDFGDGTNSNQKNPNHLYKNAGHYNVTLTVSNSINNDSKTKDFIVVVPVKNTGQVPKKIYFKLS